MYKDRVSFGNVLRYGIAFYCIKIEYSSAQCIKTGYSSAQCIKIGYSSVQCIKMGDNWAQCKKVWNRVFLALCDSFRHCATIVCFSIFWPTRARPDNYSAAG